MFQYAYWYLHHVSLPLMTGALPRPPTAGRGFAPRLTLAQRLFLLALIALLPGTLVLAYNEIELRRARLAELHVEAARNARLAASEGLGES